jgi:hypothetical protein
MSGGIEGGHISCLEHFVLALQERLQLAERRGLVT